MFTFSCTEASASDCGAALDIGVAEFESLRNSSINSSIRVVRDRINARLVGLRSLITTTDDQTALLAQRQLEAQLASQVSALDVALEETSFELQFVDEWTTAKSATVSTVSTSTYFLGVILGLVIGSLIILQFVALRSRRS